MEQRYQVERQKLMKEANAAIGEERKRVQELMVELSRPQSEPL